MLRPYLANSPFVWRYRGIELARSTRLRLPNRRSTPLAYARTSGVLRRLRTAPQLLGTLKPGYYVMS